MNLALVSFLNLVRINYILDLWPLGKHAEQGQLVLVGALMLYA